MLPASRLKTGCSRLILFLQILVILAAGALGVIGYVKEENDQSTRFSKLRRLVSEREGLAIALIMLAALFSIALAVFQEIESKEKDAKLAAALPLHSSMARCGKLSMSGEEARIRMPQPLGDYFSTVGVLGDPVISCYCKLLKVPTSVTLSF